MLGAEDAAVFCRIYDITDAGNFEGHNIPNRLAKLALEDVETEQRLIEMRAKLFAHREKRVKPGFDDKVLADWNGLMIAAIAQTGFAFERSEDRSTRSGRSTTSSSRILGRGRWPALPCLSRRYRQGAGDLGRLCQHDLGCAGAASR